MNQDLLSAVVAWDRKSAADIAVVFERFRAEGNFLSDLVECMKLGDAQAGATWLIKHALENGGAAFPGPLADPYYAAAAGLTDWAAQLHVLQCMEHVPVPSTRHPEVFAFVLSCSQSKRTLVRAWGYTGLDLMARRFPTYEAEVRAILKQASATETAGSVLARLRRATTA